MLTMTTYIKMVYFYRIKKKNKKKSHIYLRFKLFIKTEFRFKDIKCVHRYLEHTV